MKDDPGIITKGSLVIVQERELYEGGIQTP